MSHFFPLGGQSTGVSASTSVLPMNTQDWSALGWTGCTPRDSQESSPMPQFKSINSSALSFLYSPTLTSIHNHCRLIWPGNFLEMSGVEKFFSLLVCLESLDKELSDRRKCKYHHSGCKNSVSYPVVSMVFSSSALLGLSSPKTVLPFLEVLSNFDTEKEKYLGIWLIFKYTTTSVQFSCSVVSDSGPHGLQHTRPPCPSPTPGVHSDSSPSSQWCHPAISPSVVPFYY